jgi:DNA repair protein RecN (Recombination protein N)
LTIMLTYLSIKNLALIDEAELELDPGFSLLTGETGAGKSIVISALELLLGARAGADVVKSGAEKAEIEAVFTDPGKANEAVEAAGAEPADELVVRRVISAAGRSRCTVNGTTVTVGALGDIVSGLVELHGQFSELETLRAGRQTEILDDFGGLGKLRRAFEVSYAAVRELWAERDRLTKARAERETLRDSISFQIDELEKAALQEGEEEELRRRRDYLTHRVRITERVSEARELLTETEPTVTAQAARLLELVRELSEYLPDLGDNVESVQSAVVAFDELARAVGAMDEADGEGLDLETVESRLAEIERLKRKHGRDLPGLLALKGELGKRLEELTTAAERLDELESEIAAAETKTADAAAELSAARRDAAARLADAIEAELPHLGMPKAKFTVDLIEPEAPVLLANGTVVGPAGAEEALFGLSANPGEPVKPLAKVASGGELSRVMLAVRATAAREAGAATIAFDEVDVGIGGRVGHAVGDRLREVSDGRQVLCVTHLPQIAARADNHYLVEKTFEGDTTHVSVKRLNEAERVDELARMLGGGKPPTEKTLGLAKELLKASR